MKNSIRCSVALLVSGLILGACSLQMSPKASTVQTDDYLISHYEGRQPNLAINQHSWLNGAEDCSTQNAAALDVLQINKRSFILRQNPCLSGEAPFMYLLLGSRRALLLDTGDSEALPLSQTLDQLIGNLPLLVLHSHGHGDHKRGDAQLQSRPNTQVISTDLDSVKQGLGLQNWPLKPAQVELGERKIDIIPSPGHHITALTLYDNENQWLLSGDSFYPGRLIVHDWQAYKTSIARLSQFSNSHPIKAILGAHIEMTKELQADYVGSQYRPNEASLVLARKDLTQLHNTLQAMGDEPEIVAKGRFIVHPLGWAPKILISVLNIIFG